MEQKKIKDKPAPFDISIWRRATLAKEKQKERQRLQTLAEVRKAIEQLSHTYKWNELYIFGSIIRSEQFGKKSDIDIGIKGLNKYQHYRFISDLSGLLEREIDVVRLEDCPFAEAIVKRGVQWKKHE